MVDKSKIIRDEKGRIIRPIPQKTNKNGIVGRPCKCCESKDEVLRITNEYIKECADDKSKVPFMEELALKLGTNRESVWEWVKKEEDHPEFADAYKVLQTLQSLKLQIRVLGRYNPNGAIYLLKVIHKMIEVSKHIQSGEDDGPIKYEIEIVEDKNADIPEENE